jgi:hypothetical protein
MSGPNNRKPTPEPAPAPQKTSTQQALELAREHAKAAGLEINQQQAGVPRTKARLELVVAVTGLASVELAIASARLEHREANLAKREEALKASTT